MILALSFIGLLGLIIGSFLNVLIIRGAAGERITGRSHCRSCFQKLSTVDLIPVFSFLFQKGRCRYCGTAFSKQYILVELATALSFVLVFNYLQNGYFNLIFFLQLAEFTSAVCAGIVVFVSDWRYKIIPNGAVLVIFLAGFLRTWQQSNFQFNSDFKYNAGSALVFMIILGLLWLLSQGAWMGLGDVKLIPATSVFLGFPASLTAFLFSFWLGGLYGIILLLSGKQKLKSQIPFGPFIIMASVIAYMYSPIFMSMSGLAQFITTSF